MFRQNTKLIWYYLFCFINQNKHKILIQFFSQFGVDLDNNPPTFYVI
jgi:hypothetical protein